MKYIAIFFLAFLLVSSCKKQHGTVNGEPVVCFNGTVKWYGSADFDGLEWVIVDTAANKVYKITDPGAGFQVNNLAVRVCLFKTSSLFYCFCPAPMPVYEIQQISK